MEEPLLQQEEEEEEEFDNDDGSDEEQDGNMAATTTSMSTSSTHIPPRQALLLQAIFGLLGVGILVPWNAFISAKPYFLQRFCAQAGDAVDGHVENKFALCYNIAAIGWLGGMIAWQYRIDQQRAATVATTMSHSHSPPSSTHHHQQQQQSQQHDNQQQHGLWLVVIPLAMFVAVFVAQSAGVAAVGGTIVSAATFQRLTLASLALCGAAGATATAGILATAGLFPAAVGTAPFLAGQSVGGVAVSVANFVAAVLEDPAAYTETYCGGDKEATNATRMTLSSTALATNNNNDKDDTCVPYTKFDQAVFGYFVTGALVLLASLAGYIYIDYYQRQRHRNEYETVDEAAIIGHDTDDDQNNLTVDQSPRVGLELTTNDAAAARQEQEPASPGVHHRRTVAPPRKVTSNIETGYSSNNATRESFYDEPPLHSSSDNDDLLHRGSASMSTATASHHDDHHTVIDHNNETAQVWHKVRQPATCIYLVFCVTLALFPGWISELRSVRQCAANSNRWDNDLYTPAAFVLFNTCDLLGRILAGWVPVARIRPRKLVQGATLRFLCFPLLSLCVGGSATSSRIEIPSNLYSFLVQVVFGTTNGFLVTLAFIYAPTVLSSTTHVQERSAELLNFSLSFGLLSGSFLSFPVSQFLR